MRPAAHVPPEAMERVAAAPRGPWALRACAAKTPTPRSNLEAIAPETSRCTSGNRLNKTGGTSVGRRLTTPGQLSASCPWPAKAVLKVDAAHAQFCLFAGRADSRRPGGVASITVTASGFRVCGRSACVLAAQCSRHLVVPVVEVLWKPKSPSVTDFHHQ